MVKVEKKERVRYVYCKNCDAILSFSKKDIKRRSAEDWYNEYIICPECGKKVTILDVNTFDGHNYRNSYDKKRMEDV